MAVEMMKRKAEKDQGALGKTSLASELAYIWVFPKIGVPPNHQF